MCEVLLITKKGKRIVDGVSTVFVPKSLAIKMTAGERALFQARQPKKSLPKAHKSRPSWIGELTASQARAIGFAR